MSASSRGYGVTLGAIIVGLLAFSAAALYTLFGQVAHFGAAEIYGQLQAVPSTSGLGSLIRPPEVATVRDGRFAELAALSRRPAPPEPVDGPEVRPGAGPAAVPAVALVQPLPAAATPPVPPPPTPLDLARHAWWDGRLAEADSILESILDAKPDAGDARTLQLQVRESMTPDVERARQWLGARDGAIEYLWLARAYARADRPAEALPHYREAIRRGVFGDSLHLELAAIALTADSSLAAAEAFERFLLAHPDAIEQRLHLARAYSWAGRPEDAAREFARVRAEAEEAEEVVLAATADSALAALIASSSEAKEDEAGAADADSLAGGRHAPQLAWSVAAESFGDNQDFRWREVRARGSWRTGPVSVGLAVGSDRGEGRRGPERVPVEDGFALEGIARVALRDHLRVSVGGGFRDDPVAGTIPIWAGSLEAVRPGGRLELAYRRDSGVRAAGTAASREAGLIAHRVSLTGGHWWGDWSLWAEGAMERLVAEPGSNERWSGSTAVSRALGGGVHAVAGIGAVAAGAESPELAGWGPLYWAPEMYVAPTLGLRLDTPIGGAVRGGLRLTPGVAFVREPAGTVRRFEDGRVAFLATGGDLTYGSSGWEVGLSADWSGALDAGYRAAALRLRVTSRPVWP